MIMPTAPRLKDSKDAEEVRKSLLDMARQMGQSGSRFGRYPDSYAEFEDDGTLMLYGDALVYDDINMPFATGRTSSSNAPGWATVSGLHGAFRFAVNDYIQVGARELEHDWAEATEIEIHVHWMPFASDTTDRAVRWECSYMAADMNSVFSAPQTLSAEATIPANTPALMHLYTTIGTIKVPARHIGAYISTVIRRVAATGGLSAPSENPFGIALGIHYQIDSLGSRSISGK
jgi:hypothetical protein